MHGGIGVRYKFIKIEIGKGIVNGEKGLVPGNGTQKSQRHLAISLSYFNGTQQSAKATQLPWLGIAELDFLIIEIAFQNIFHPIGIGQEQGAVIIIDVPSLHPVPNSSFPWGIDQHGIYIKLFDLRGDSRRRCKVHII